MPQFAYCKRVFLHPPTTGKNSYICAIAESSDGGTNEAAEYVIIIADCHHAVELEEREESFAKVELLSEVLTSSVTHYIAKLRRYEPPKNSFAR